METRVHHKNCSKLINDMATRLKADCSHLLLSGAIDIEQYKGRDLALAKILLTATVLRDTDAWSKADFAPYKDLKEIENLRKI